MKVVSCNPGETTVSPAAYNACAFAIIDKWEPKQHAKTCDTMFYLSDGTGAYVWNCDEWIFLRFAGGPQPDWKAKENEAGGIKNKPFETLGNGLVVSKEGVLSVNVTPEDIGAQRKLVAGTGITIDSTDKEKPIISVSGEYASESELRNHIEDTNNPHKVTAELVGAYGKEEADETFAKKAELDTHIKNTDNPHEVTAAQVDAYTKKETDDKFSKNTDLTNHLNDKKNPHGVTASQTGAYSKTEADEKFSKKEDLTSHVNDKENPHEVTAHQVGALTAEESSANVINSIGGTEAAVLKKELLVNGVEGTASRYVKDLPYKENILMKSGRFLDYGVATNEGWKATLLDNGNLQITVPTQTAQHFRIPLHGIKSLKKNDTLSLAVRAKADQAITLPFGVTKEYTALSWAGGKINLSSAMDTIKTSGKIGTDGEINYLYMTSTSFDASLAGTKIEIEFLKLVENDEVDDTWCPSAEDLGIVHGQPNLLNGTSNEWVDYTFTSWDNGKNTQLLIADAGLKAGDTITLATEFNNKAGVSSALCKLFINKGGENLLQRSGNPISPGTIGRSLLTVTIPEGADKIFWYHVAKSDATNQSTIAARGHKLIKGSAGAMDEWTPSQADSGLTIVNNGMVPFTDEEYNQLLSEDGIVQSESLEVGRRAAADFEFTVIETLETRYPFIFENCGSMNEKLTHLRKIIQESWLEYTTRVVTLGSRAVDIYIYTPWNDQFSGITADPNAEFKTFKKTHDLFKTQFTQNGTQRFRLSTNGRSDGVTPALLEIKDIRLTISVEVNGRTIIESFIAAYSGENSLRIVNDTSIVEQNWNTITEQGIYEVQQATGSNRAGVWGTLQVNRVGDSDIISQTFIGYDSISVRRRANGGSWSNWSRFTNNTLPPGIQEFSFSVSNTSFIQEGSIDFVKIGDKMQMTFDFVASQDMPAGSGIEISTDDPYATYWKTIVKQTTVKNGEVFETSVIWKRRKIEFSNGLRAGDRYQGSMNPIAGT
nr:MAG TPA: structural protein [Caudoviricetes sp.]